MELTWIKQRWNISIEMITIKSSSLGEKSGSELQNENGNFGMVKMNSKTIFISHLIIFKSYLLLWLWFYSIFIMKHVFLIHFMLFWTGFTADEQISRANLFKEWFDHRAYFYPYFLSFVKNKKGPEVHFYLFFELW